MESKKFYLCGHENVSTSCQIVEAYSGQDLEQAARRWGVDNFYNIVFVYDALKNKVASYEIEWEDGRNY